MTLQFLRLKGRFFPRLFQFVMQPILILGVLFHFTMGFVLEYQNTRARPVRYVMKNDHRNSSWISRNMIFSGSVILAFLGLHFYDFWFPEMRYKYIEFKPPNEQRYFSELPCHYNLLHRQKSFVTLLLGLHDSP